MKNATATTVGASRPRRFGVRFWLSLDAVLWILLGVLAIVAPLIAGLATVALFAVLLIAAGVVGLVGLFRSGRRGAWGWRLVSTIAAFVAGVLLLLDLFLGAWTITLLVAAHLIASGVTAAVAAFRRGSCFTTSPSFPQPPDGWFIPTFWLDRSSFAPARKRRTRPAVSDARSRTTAAGRKYS